MTLLAPVLAAAMVVAQTAPASVSIPDTPAGRVAAAYIEASNSGDFSKVEAFVRSHSATPEKMLANPQLKEIFERTQGFKLVGVPASSDHDIVVHVDSRRSGRPLTLVISVSPQPPHNIASLGVRVEPGTP